jgi:hypothetical protein
LDVRPVYLVLLDISGYTRFTTAHRVSVLHAEKIIGELLESILSKSKHPLIVHELLGDAVSLYVAAGGTAEVAGEIRRQVTQIFAAFRRREAELISDCAICSCEACMAVGKLKLKAILHFGQAVFTRIRGFPKLAGEDVILAHRLLKNSVASGEYVLETEPLYRLGGGFTGMTAQETTDAVEGLGSVFVRVFLFPEASREVVASPRSAAASVLTHVKVDLHTFARNLGLRRKVFRNLEPPSE